MYHQHQLGIKCLVTCILRSVEHNNFVIQAEDMISEVDQGGGGCGIAEDKLLAPEEVASSDAELKPWFVAVVLVFAVLAVSSAGAVSPLHH